MKHVALPLTVALLLTCSAVTPMLLLPVSQAQPTTLLSVDFTGSSLPQGWTLQGSAKFIGGLNSSSGVGGIQLVYNDSQAGAVIYDSAFTAQNVIIEFSGMYEPGSSSLPQADDIGLGFYSDGPSTHGGPENPAAANGYYASYEFSNLLGYINQYDFPNLVYNAHSLSSEGSRFIHAGRLPSRGRNYLFAETTVTPTSVSMNALTRTDSPWIQEPSISLGCLRNMVTYNNATGIDSSHSTLYVGGATFTGLLFGNPWSNEYVYWLRILPYSTTPTTSTSSCNTSSSTSSSLSSAVIQQSSTQSVPQTLTSIQTPPTQIQTVTPSSTQTVSQGQTTPTPVLGVGGASSVLSYAVIGLVVVVTIVLVGVFLMLRSRGRKGIAEPASSAPKFCRSCGSPLSELERFCDRCGAPQA